MKQEITDFFRIPAFRGKIQTGMQEFYSGQGIAAHAVLQKIRRDGKGKIPGLARQKSAPQENLTGNPPGGQRFGKDLFKPSGGNGQERAGEGQTGLERFRRPRRTFPQFRNQVFHFRKLPCPEQEFADGATERIRNGGYTEYMMPDSYELEIKSCTLSYSDDSKGFYQPVYVFECSIISDSGTEEETILVPALA